MTSTKGTPTDQPLHDKIKDRTYHPYYPPIRHKRNTNAPISEIQKDSPGGWAAWKAAKLAKEYEKQGGGYKNEKGSKNKPVKGPPQHKKEEEKKAATEGDVEEEEEEEEADGAEDEDKEEIKDKKKPGSHVLRIELAQGVLMTV